MLLVIDLDYKIDRTKSQLFGAARTPDVCFKTMRLCRFGLILFGRHVPLLLHRTSTIATRVRSVYVRRIWKEFSDTFYSFNLRAKIFSFVPVYERLFIKRA